LTITTEKRGNNIRISFQDDGPGISKENMVHLFEPFFTTKAPGEGTGLGLSLSHSIILEHGGEMNVESEPGHGATFIIDLPIVDVLPPEADVPYPKAKVKPAVTKKGRILVVDDEPGIRGLIKKTLTQTGHSVDTSGDPKEALDKLAGATYDVLFLDIRMPGMSGIDLYALIQEKAPAMANRIIFITGDTMGIDVKAFLVQNNLAYLSKPFDLEGLKEKVDIILGADQPENDSPDRSGK
jgi:CheY-like chemotaxis protein